MAKQAVLSKDGKLVSFDIDRAEGQKVGKSVLGAGTGDYAARSLKGFRVTLTTSPRDLIKKQKFRDNIRKKSAEILGVLPVMFPVTSTGLLVLEYEDVDDDQKIVEAISTAIRETKFKGFWIF